ncbi:membrane-associated protein, putative, partial [Bodo saltans]
MERRGCSECRTQLLIAALCVLFGIQLISSNLAPAIASQAVPLLPQQRERAAAGRVALCFFGLVKDIDEDLIRSLSEGIVKPLTAAGFSLDSFLHTYHATTFFNAFNKETDGATFNQSKSLATLKGLLPNLKVATDFISTPDRLMPLERYL